MNLAVRIIDALYSTWKLNKLLVYQTIEGSDEIYLGCQDSRFDFEESKPKCIVAEEPSVEFTKFRPVILKSNL